MDKSSTPSNRCTRSRAKQKSTPSRTEREVNVDHSPDGILTSGRKLRRKQDATEINAKTNGETSSVADSKRSKNSVDIADANSLDGCQSDSSNACEKQKNSPKPSTHKLPSPTISRKSLRLRRSVTPGPDAEASPSARLRRSRSESKLESTPNKRNKRAVSESKDYVYNTPTKNSGFNPSSFKLSTIEKIDEDNEHSDSSQDDTTLSEYAKKSVKPSFQTNLSVSPNEKEEINRICPTNTNYLSDITSEISNEDCYKNNSGSAVHEDEQLSSLPPAQEKCPDNDFSQQSEFENAAEKLPCISESGFSQLSQVILDSENHLIKSAEEGIVHPQEIDNLQQDVVPSDDGKEHIEENVDNHTTSATVSDSKFIDNSPNSKITVSSKSGLDLETEENKSCSNETLIIPINKVFSDHNKKDVTETEYQISISGNDKNSIDKIVSQESNGDPRCKPINDSLEKSDDEKEVANDEVEKTESQELNEVKKFDGDMTDKRTVSNNESNKVKIMIEGSSQSHNEPGTGLITGTINRVVSLGDFVGITENNNFRAQTVEFVEIVSESGQETSLMLQNVNETNSQFISSKDVTSEQESELDKSNVNYDKKAENEEIEEYNNYRSEGLSKDKSVEFLEAKEDGSELSHQKSIDCTESKHHEPVLIEDSENSDDANITNNQINNLESKTSEEKLCRNTEEFENDQTEQNDQTVKVIHFNIPSNVEPIVTDKSNVNYDKEQEIEEYNYQSEGLGKDESTELVEPKEDGSELSPHRSIDCIESEHHDPVLIEDSENSDDVNIKNHQINSLESNIGEEKLCGNTEEFGNNQSEQNDPTVKVIHFNIPGNIEPIITDSFSQNGDSVPSFVCKKDDAFINYQEANTVGNKECNEQLEHDRVELEDQCFGTNSEPKSFEYTDQGNYDEVSIESNGYHDSGSNNSDILYKDMIGSDGEEDEDRSSLDESGSHETGDSDENISDQDDDNLKDNVKDEREKSVVSKEIFEEEIEKKCKSSQGCTPANEPKNVQDEKKVLSGDSDQNNGSAYDTTSPITYDKALAILNKNSDKKIDDEEFFDMFTQELNRVSTEEGADSDSDIAIVDEWIPENKPTPKPVIKTIKQLQAFKQAQRAQMAMARQTGTTPFQHFGGHLGNEEATEEHQAAQQQLNQGPSKVPKINFPHGPMYDQFGQNVPHIPGIGEQTTYNQFATNSLPEHRMFHPHLPTNVSFPSTDIYGQHLRHAQEYQSQSPPACPPGMRISNMESFNNTFYNSQSYGETSQRLAAESFEMNQREEIMNDGYNRDSGNDEAKAVVSHEEVYGCTSANDVQQDDETNTPLLNLLKKNDKTSLIMLEKLLKPYSKKRGKRRHRKKRMDRINQNLDALKELAMGNFSHKLYKKKTKREKEDQQLGLINSLFNRKTAYASSDRSSDSNSQGPIAMLRYSKKNAERKLVNELDNGNVYVTIPLLNKDKIESQPILSKKNRKRKQILDSSDDSYEFVMLKKKPKRMVDKYKSSSSCDSSEVTSLKIKKKQKSTLKKKKNIRSSVDQLLQEKKKKKEPSILKSNCGTFTVDSIPSTSSSDCETTSLDQSSESSMEDLRKSLLDEVKRELGTGKTMKSNVFNQHSDKNSKKKQESQKKSGNLQQKKRSLRKLPTEVLERLTKDGEKRKRQESSTESELPKQLNKNKKRRTKVKVKSAVAEEGYIPFVASGATQFALSRLDKEGVLSAAQKAAKFRNDHLYGSAVKRITSKDLINVFKKQEANQCRK